MKDTVLKKSQSLNRFSQSYYLGEWNGWEYFISGEKVYIAQFDEVKPRYLYISVIKNNSIVDFKPKYPSENYTIADFKNWLNTPVGIKGKNGTKIYNAIEQIQRFSKTVGRGRLRFGCGTPSTDENHFLSTAFFICPLKKTKYLLTMVHNNTKYQYSKEVQPFGLKVLERISDRLRGEKSNKLHKHPMEQV